MTPEQREKQQRSDRRRYEIKRALAILLMGCKCHYCPERRPWKLEFHHTVRVKWNPKKTSRFRRIKLYLRDWGDNKVVLACGTCNKEKGRPPASKECPDEVIPF